MDQVTQRRRNESMSARATIQQLHLHLNIGHKQAVSDSISDSSGEFSLPLDELSPWSSMERLHICPQKLENNERPSDRNRHPHFGHDGYHGIIPQGLLLLASHILADHSAKAKSQFDNGTWRREHPRGHPSTNKPMSQQVQSREARSRSFPLL